MSLIGRKKTLLLALSALLGLGGISFAVGATESPNYQEMRAERTTVASVVATSIASGTSYGAKTNDNWVMTYGTSSYIGTNANNRSSCTLSSYAKYADGTNVTSSEVAVAVANLTELKNVGQITFSYSDDHDTKASNTKVYLNYSSDNTTFTPIALTSGTQGEALPTPPTEGSAEISFEFAACSGYFAFIFDGSGTSSGAWRFGGTPTLTFYTPASYADSVESVTLSQTTASIDVGETVELTATVAPATADPGIVWSSNNEAVAKVEAGVVTGVGAGNATITATSVGAKADGTFATATCDVTVTMPSSFTDKLTVDNLSLTETGSGYKTFKYESALTGIVYEGYRNNTDSYLQFRSSNDPVYTSANPNGYQLASISVDWNTSGDEARKATFYGSNTAFTSSPSSSDQKLLESTKSSTDTHSVALTPTYKFVGFVVDGAAYFDSITFEWAIPETLEKIEITKQPSKTEYNEGEYFSDEGMEVTATIGGEPSVVTGYTFSPDEQTPLKTTDTKVTVSYTLGAITATADVAITVTSNPVTGIQVTTNPTKTDYYVGENLDLAGMVITATYQNGSESTYGPFDTSADYTEVTTDPAINAALAVENVTVKVTYLNQEATFTITVSERTFYTKVTAENPIVLGAQVVFIAEGSGSYYAMGEASGNYRNGVSVTLQSNGTFGYVDGVSVFTIGSGSIFSETANTYSFMENSDSNYLYSVDGETHLRTETIPASLPSKAAAWTVTDGSAITSVGTNRQIRSTTSGSFRGYSSLGSTLAVSIYQYVPASTTIDMFVHEFMEGTGAGCASTETTKLDDISYAIMASEETFNKLSADDQATVKAASPTENTMLGKMIERYDYIFEIYGADAEIRPNFLNRNIPANAIRYMGAGQESNTYITILAVMGGAVLTGGIYFAMKKRSSRKEEE